MLKLQTLFLFLISISFCNGQNLVPNGNFEQHDSCPSEPGDLTNCSGWINPSTNGGTPDYFNSCATFQGMSVPHNSVGYQLPHSGNAYIGIFLMQQPYADIREYAEVQLTSALVSDTTYTFNMYVNLGNFCMYTTSSFGAYVSDTPIYSTGFNPLNFTPQLKNPDLNIPDTAQWKLVSLEYKAKGGEQYLIIGNFETDNGSNIILYDTAASNYTGAYILIDDVSLTPTRTTAINKLNDENPFRIFPDPFATEIKVTSEDNSKVEFSLWDVTARLVYNNVFESATTINTESLTPGLYFYQVKNRNGMVKKGKLVKI